MSQNSSLNSLVAHSRQNQCYVLDWGSRTDLHCSRVLEFHLALKLSSIAQAYENAASQT
jgi:hypothetical protein